MRNMDTFIPKDGSHKGQVVVVTEIMNSGVHKCLTLQGDFHYYDNEQNELIRKINFKTKPFSYKYIRLTEMQQIK